MCDGGKDKVNYLRGRQVGSSTGDCLRSAGAGAVPTWNRTAGRASQGHPASAPKPAGPPFYPPFHGAIFPTNTPRRKSMPHPADQEAKSATPPHGLPEESSIRGSKMASRSLVSPRRSNGLRGLCAALPRVSPAKKPGMPPVAL